MTITYLLATSLASGLGVLADLSPELDAFVSHDVKLHPDKFSIFASDFSRADKAKLRLYSTVHSSNESLHEAVDSEVLAGMNFKPPPGSPAWQRLHSSPSGNPLGDLLWKFEDTNSKSIRLRVGAGTVYVDAYLSYYGVRAAGRVTWEVQDHAADRVLVEDLARRIVGRTLAFERFAKVKDGTLPTNATEATDVSGKLFTSLPHWTSSQSLATTQERRVSRSGRARTRSRSATSGNRSVLTWSRSTTSSSSPGAGSLQPYREIARPPP
jgi:hypothetical protein